MENKIGMLRLDACKTEQMKEMKAEEQENQRMPDQEDQGSTRNNKAASNSYSQEDQEI